MPEPSEAPTHFGHPKSLRYLRCPSATCVVRPLLAMSVRYLRCQSAIRNVRPQPAVSVRDRRCVGRACKNRHEHTLAKTVTNTRAGSASAGRACKNRPIFKTIKFCKKRNLHHLHHCNFAKLRRQSKRQGRQDAIFACPSPEMWAFTDRLGDTNKPVGTPRPGLTATTLIYAGHGVAHGILNILNGHRAGVFNEPTRWPRCGHG